MTGSLGRRRNANAECRQPGRQDRRSARRARGPITTRNRGARRVTDEAATASSQRRGEQETARPRQSQDARIQHERGFSGREEGCKSPPPKISRASEPAAAPSLCKALRKGYRPRPVPGLPCWPVNQWGAMPQGPVEPDDNRTFTLPQDALPRKLSTPERRTDEKECQPTLPQHSKTYTPGGNNIRRYERKPSNRRHKKYQYKVRPIAPGKIVRGTNRQQ